jgi:hypothetical protein
MPRSASTRKKPVPIVAGSPSLVSHMLGIRADDIRDMIADGLPVYTKGLRRRILLKDAEKFLRKWKRVQPKQHRSVPNADNHQAS